MRVAKTISITLPPDMLARAQEVARRESRTMSELVRESLRKYMAPGPIALDPEWEELLRHTRERGRALGVTSEEDVERISNEYSQEKRNRQAATR